MQNFKKQTQTKTIKNQYSENNIQQNKWLIASKHNWIIRYQSKLYNSESVGMLSGHRHFQSF